MLDQKLEKYAQSNIYPFHMPGHKRVPLGEMNPYEIDITEIDGFDNLHEAEGVLAEAMERAAQMYKAKKTYYLVNGSTCGLLAAISASLHKGAPILVARNCHKAAYHGLSLWQCQADYLYPKMLSMGILGEITPQMVEEAVAAAKEKGISYEALLITSPTYDGIVSDIAGIADICHRNNMTFIVDEAHGAHFSLSPFFPKSSVELGADLVIQSMHKTLPSFTQTALLHICSDRVDEAEVERYLDYYETSSPSYVLMAGMERCLRFLREEGDRRFCAYFQRLDDFYQQTADLRFLRVAQPMDFSMEAYAFDSSKILIFTEDSGLTGPDLYDLLLEEYQIQLEMSSLGYVLAMTSLLDSDQGFSRLKDALFDIEDRLAAGEIPRRKQNEEPQDLRSSFELPNIYGPNERVCPIDQAEEKDRDEAELFSIKEAAGKVSTQFIYLYPPGIPLLVPGERISQKLTEDIMTCRHLGIKVYGLTENNEIRVMK